MSDFLKNSTRIFEFTKRLTSLQIAGKLFKTDNQAAKVATTTEKTMESNQTRENASLIMGVNLCQPPATRDITQQKQKHDSVLGFVNPTALKRKFESHLFKTAFLLFLFLLAGCGDDDRSPLPDYNPYQKPIQDGDELDDDDDTSIDDDDDSISTDDDDDFDAVKICETDSDCNDIGGCWDGFCECREQYSGWNCQKCALGFDGSDYPDCEQVRCTDGTWACKDMETSGLIMECLDGKWKKEMWDCRKGAATEVIDGEIVWSNIGPPRECQMPYGNVYDPSNDGESVTFEDHLTAFCRGCNETQTGIRRCDGDNVEECNGTSYGRLQDCTVLGMTCQDGVCQ